MTSAEYGHCLCFILNGFHPTSLWAESLGTDLVPTNAHVAGCLTAAHHSLCLHMSLSLGLTFFFSQTIFSEHCCVAFARVHTDHYFVTLQLLTCITTTQLSTFSSSGACLSFHTYKQNSFPSPFPSLRQSLYVIAHIGLGFLIENIKFQVGCGKEGLFPCFLTIPY